LISLLHAGAERTAADEHQHVAGSNSSRLDGGDRRRLGHEDLGRTGEAIDAIRADDRRIDRGCLDHRPFRREVADRGAERRRQSPPRRVFRRHDHIARIDPVARAQPVTQPRPPLRGFPLVELLPEREPADRERAGLEQTGAAQMEHDFGHRTGLEHLHGRMMPRTIRQSVDQTRHAAVDRGPIGRGRAAEARGMRDRRQVQDQVGRTAERGVGHHRVVQGGIGEDVAHAHPARFEPHQRGRRSSRHVEPDRVAGRGEGRVPERHAQRFADHLRRGGGAEELTSAPRRGAGAAAEIRRLLEREFAVHVAHADGLNPGRVLALHREQRDPARHQHTWEIVARRQRHHHRRQTLVAGGDPEHAAAGGQRANQPAKYRRRVVAIRQAVEHRRRPLRAPIARIGA
jgi:hypothetical protein